MSTEVESRRKQRGHDQAWRDVKGYAKEKRRNRDPAKLKQKKKNQVHHIQGSGGKQKKSKTGFCRVFGEGRGRRTGSVEDTKRDSRPWGLGKKKKGEKRGVEDGIQTEWDHLKGKRRSDPSNEGTP